VLTDSSFRKQLVTQRSTKRDDLTAQISTIGLMKRLYYAALFAKAAVAI
jgi:hypothetical protein